MDWVGVVGRGWLTGVEGEGVDAIVMHTCWHGSVFLQVLTLQLHPEGAARDWGLPASLPSPALLSSSPLPHTHTHTGRIMHNESKTHQQEVPKLIREIAAAHHVPCWLVSVSTSANYIFTLLSVHYYRTAINNILRKGATCVMTEGFAWRDRTSSSEIRRSLQTATCYRALARHAGNADLSIGLLWPRKKNMLKSYELAEERSALHVFPSRQEEITREG